MLGLISDWVSRPGLCLTSGNPQGPSQPTTDASRVVVLFNEHFGNTAIIFATFGKDCDSSLTSNDNLSEFINDRMPFNVYFTISFTSCESVFIVLVRDP